tara:strand:+ start:258 stop:479 length:222 start_codon:yes stop_codon:yes gene_type:complete
MGIRIQYTIVIEIIVPIELDQVLILELLVHLPTVQVAVAVVEVEVVLVAVVVLAAAVVEVAAVVVEYKLISID